MKYSIFIFESIHRVLKAEKLLLEKDIKLEIITTPKEITSQCGMSIRINPEISNITEITKILRDNNLEFEVFEKEMV